ncbi:ADP-ribosylation factor-like protein 16 isoform X2 [Amblyraja radiata]|uniref:ADP-ribosylation factor-like protein 16 isoform X2 n=1 Tax=Amblyraja radiata TaxID=386614 RepID=UPI001401BEE7|nr:ADP-ribosylation factor-like protein 16 isoform X2 [Amblyraja radiata]
MSLKGVTGDLDETPPTLPTVGTNLTDITINKRRITIRELGGCMGPIWPSYYADSEAVMFVIDAANPTQISSSCIQLLEVLTAEQLQETPILILFNKVVCSLHSCNFKTGAER